MDIFTKYSYIFGFLNKYFSYLNEPDVLEEFSSDSETESEYDDEDYISE